MGKKDYLLSLEHEPIRSKIRRQINFSHQMSVHFTTNAWQTKNKSRHFIDQSNVWHYHCSDAIYGFQRVGIEISVFKGLSQSCKYRLIWYLRQ